MKIYYIALGIIIFSASLQISNDMDVFANPLPNTKFDSANGTVTALTSTSTSTDPTIDIFGIGMMLKSVGYMTSALTAAITIIPLAIQYDIDSRIYMPIQGIIWFVYGMGLFQLLTGRSTKLYD